MIKLAHLINPVACSSVSDLFAAQPITFETMRRARASAQGIVEVDQVAAFFPEDSASAPADFRAAPLLERSILDFGDFTLRRRLPLIRDLLDRLHAATDADYLVYTNVDIALQPTFYVEVARFIEQGHRAFVINRRTITKEPSALDALPQMLAQAGEPHPGHDCFIWARGTYPGWRLENLAIGTIGIGKGLILNQLATAENFTEFTDLRLTFHLGADRAWQNSDLDDYRQFNLGELRKIVNSFRQTSALPDHPLVARFIKNLGV